MVGQMLLLRAKPLRGGATLELAITAPILLTIFLGIIEFGRAIMVQHTLEEAARAACRVAILASATTDSVESMASSTLSAAGIEDYTLTIDPSDLSQACRWSPVTVTISTPYSSVSWLPLPRFLDGVTLRGQCTMPREAGDECASDQNDSDEDGKAKNDDDGKSKDDDDGKGKGKDDDDDGKGKGKDDDDGKGKS